MTEKNLLIKNNNQSENIKEKNTTIEDSNLNTTNASNVTTNKMLN
jgi:hypothetical protein